MDRFQALEVFCAIADSGSFTKAGKRLRLSPPAVTRALAGLEDRLGTRLLNRTTRSLSLTEAGIHFLDSAKRILGDLDQAEKAAAGEAAAPTGHLTLTAPVTFGRMHATPLLLEFLRAYPRVTASLMLLDRIVSLTEEGIDAAIRIGDLPDSSVMARQASAPESRRRGLVPPRPFEKSAYPSRYPFSHRKSSDATEYARAGSSGCQPGAPRGATSTSEASTV